MAYGMLQPQLHATATATNLASSRAVQSADSTAFMDLVDDASGGGGGSGQHDQQPSCLGRWIAALPPKKCLGPEGGGRIRRDQHTGVAARCTDVRAIDLYAALLSPAM